MPAPLIDVPASTDTHRITPLGAIDGYDAVLDDDYAFVAYTETDVATGEWRVRVRGRHMTGVVFEPEAMRRQARSAGAQGKAYFTWGAGIEPSAGDPRMVEYRVHVADGKPSAIEIALRLRKADGSAGEPKSLVVPWPG